MHAAATTIGATAITTTLASSESTVTPTSALISLYWCWRLI